MLRFRRRIWNVVQVRTFRKTRVDMSDSIPPGVRVVFAAPVVSLPWPTSVAGSVRVARMITESTEHEINKEPVPRSLGHELVFMIAMVATIIV